MTFKPRDMQEYIFMFSTALYCKLCGRKSWFYGRKYPFT